MKKRVRERYIREQFNPGWLGLFVNPFFFARRGLCKSLAELLPKLEKQILDIGCGRKPYQYMCTYTKYVGLEIDTPEKRAGSKADHFYNGTEMPFSNHSYDSAFASQVFEHVFNPEEFLQEINRVLKTGGKFLITVPFIWDEHEQPFDYARYSSFGLKHILKKKGFRIIEHRRINRGTVVIFQLINAYLYKLIWTQNIYINLIATLILMAPVNIFGHICSFILPKKDDMYLDNIILAEKTHDL